MVVVRPKHFIFLLKISNSCVVLTIHLWFSAPCEEICHLFCSCAEGEGFDGGSSGVRSAHVLAFEVDVAPALFGSKQVPREPFIAALKADLVFKLCVHKSISIINASEF